MKLIAKYPVRTAINPFVSSIGGYCRSGADPYAQ